MTERTVKARFQVDVGNAVAGVGKLTRSLEDAASAGDTVAQRNTDAFDGVARAAATVGAAAAVGLGAAVAKFAEFDKSMSNVQAATMESAGNMGLLREAALAAGKDTAFSASEAAAGIENLAKAGVSTKEILGGGLKGALDLAAAGQIDVATAAETAATAMTQFNLKGSEVPHIADLLAAGAGKAQGEVGDLAAALNQSGLVASQFGLDIEDTVGTLAAFASAGLGGSDAGTSFKTMLLALANPSKEAAGAMKELGINAYDAEGAFIGIAPLADQLKTKMSGLSEQQRNAALATIFGTDAIRAANVLYTQGATGIVDWTNKVNDTGFAAEQARLKTDNLAGDVERLGGALDTALIQGGSGANDVLRALTQGADSALTGFAELPPVVTGTATALAAVATIGGLGAAGVLKAATAAGELKTQWQGLGRTGKTLTLSMGAVGVALVAAAAIYGIFAQRNEEAKQKSEDLRSTLDQQTGAITQNTRAAVAKQLADTGLSAKARELGLNLSTVTDAALGNSGALGTLTTQLDAVIASGTRSGYVGNSHKTVLTAQAQAAQQLKNDLTGTNAALTDAQQKQRDAAAGAQENKSAVVQAAEAHKKATEATQAQTAALSDLISEMLKVPGQTLSLRDAQRQAEDAFDDATAAIKENGRTLDITSPKGRANAAALDTIARSANDLTKTLAENGGSQKALQGNLNTSRQRLISVGTSMGMTRKAAEDYAKKVLAIPPAVLTKVTNNAPAARKPVQDYLTSVGLIPTAKKTSVSVPGATGSKTAVDGLRTSLQKLPANTTSKVTVNTYRNLIETKTIRPDVGVRVTGGAGGASGGWKGALPPGTYRIGGGLNSYPGHTGQDYPASSGTPVFAMKAGTVSRALSMTGSYGKHVYVDHGGGLQTRYAHLSSIGVAAGSQVGAGQRIGAVGSTGNSTGPHLHLEVRSGGRILSPRAVTGFAEGGWLPKQAKIQPAVSGRGLVQWAEPETEGEAFIPLAKSKRLRSTKILATVADQFGMSLVQSFADGGITGFDFTTLFRQMFPNIAANPLAGLDTTKTAAATKTALENQRKMLAAYRAAIAEARTASIRQNTAEKSVAAQKTRISILRATGASDATIRKAQLELIKRTNTLNAAKAKTRQESREMATAEGKYTNSMKAATKAAEAHQAAVQKLAETRKEAADFAKSVAAQQLQGSGLGDLFTAGTGRAGLLQKLQGRGKSLAGFATTLEGLQKAGLSRDLLDQLRSGGPDSAALAKEILSGGKGYITQLNNAQIGLQAQANRIGAGAAQQHYNVAYLTTNISIGNEVVRTVNQVIQANNAALRRAATQRRA